MKYGLSNTIDFAVGIGLTIFGLITMLKTNNLVILIVALLVFIFGLSRLGKSKIEFTK